MGGQTAETAGGTGLRITDRSRTKREEGQIQLGKAMENLEVVLDSAVYWKPVKHCEEWRHMI